MAPKTGDITHKSIFMKKTKKQNSKTLRVSKTTITVLTQQQAQGVAGGAARAQCANNLKQLSLA